ncbi:hypothetical protein [Algiphilus aromaticivorans]|uniref:hypothetical protein n=1 Tax=Algiphilus aromaticivorans TaxID=382454 RepID=UPI0005C1B94B|nr:hypothetical protein [Algiphilus aromaticivorans]
MSESEKVVLFPGITKLDLPADRVLDAAKDQLDRCVILGYDADGEEYFASSIADGGDVLWLIERMKKALLEVPDR